MKHGIITTALLLSLTLLMSACVSPPRTDADPDIERYAWFEASRRYVDTDYGRIAVVERGRGPVAVYLHGFPLNAWHWRHQLGELADIRRGIAIDLMGLGHTEISADQDLRFSTQADMVLATLDAMGVREFDLVGNDSGGGIAQLIVARAPERVRSLVLSNADVHDNWPPQALGTVHELATRGQMDEVLQGYMLDVDSARAGLAGLVYQDAMFVSEDMLQIYMTPLLETPDRRAAVNRFIATQDNAETVAIKPALEQFNQPTLIMWGTDDVFFGVEWAHWLRDTIPGAYAVVEFDGARLFFAEERADEVNALLRAHFQFLDRDRSGLGPIIVPGRDWPDIRARQFPDMSRLR
ncbi:MAG: alpha/beta hydrolase [Pseudohongiella sp.]|uniref:alpha/beta fold hydrolase n=1 Tax=Pseudohongiella sp. TaxID=1979412 RepID=UPI0034A069CF